MLANKLLAAQMPSVITPAAEIFYTGYFSSTTSIAANAQESFSMPIGAANVKRYIVISIYYRAAVTNYTSVPAIYVNGALTTAIVVYLPETGSYNMNAIYVTDAPVINATNTSIAMINGAQISTRRQYFAYAFIPSGAAPQVLASAYAKDSLPSGSLSWDFSAQMITGAVGIHLTALPNIGTISTATGDMVYADTTKIISTAYSRPGIIQYPGIYQTPVSSSYSQVGIAAVLT